jgi:hypothetical protein
LRQEPISTSSAPRSSIGLSSVTRIFSEVCSEIAREQFFYAVDGIWGSQALTENREGHSENDGAAAQVFWTSNGGSALAGYFAIDGR